MNFLPGHDEKRSLVSAAESAGMTAALQRSDPPKGMSHARNQCLADDRAWRHRYDGQGFP
jgi:hypothetical protein